MIEPVAPEHSLNDHPSPACHWRAKSAATASGSATLAAAARSPLVHASYRALAWSSGEDPAGAVVTGRDGAAVIVTVVVVVGRDDDELVAVATVVGAAGDAGVSESPEHADATATTAKSAVAAERRAGPTMAETYPGAPGDPPRVSSSDPTPASGSLGPTAGAAAGSKPGSSSGTRFLSRSPNGSGALPGGRP